MRARFNLTASHSRSGGSEIGRPIPARQRFQFGDAAAQRRQIKMFQRLTETSQTLRDWFHFILPARPSDDNAAGYGGCIHMVISAAIGGGKLIDSGCALRSISAYTSDQAAQIGQRQAILAAGSACCRSFFAIGIDAWVEPV